MTIVGSTPIPFDAQYLRFLAVEENQERRLVAFFAQARGELSEFLANPPVPLTAPEQAFYGAVQSEVDRLSRNATVQGATWAQIIPQSFAEGALQHSPQMAFNVVHDNAARALSGYTLNLITAMSDDMRRVVQQQIGVGLLEGATREVVSQRILASGLTNIPHWRSVEDRAAAIARTEMMRAYNAGNLTGIIDTGAVAVKWITGHDERVCPICGPRHGQLFRIPGRSDDESVDPNVRSLPNLDPPPAHPRCRCTIRAAYDFGGTVTEPTPPEGGVIEQTPTPPAPPPGTQTFDEQFRRLKAHELPTDADMNMAKSFWHDAELDDDQIAQIADLAEDTDAFGIFVEGRYGVESFSVRSSGLRQYWIDNPDVRIGVIRGLERYRLAFRRNVDGSSYFKSLALDNKGMGFNTLADCSYTGEIRLAVDRFTKYLKPGSGVRTKAADVSGIEEIMVHELGHAMHNRFGVVITSSRSRYGGLSAKAAELGGGYTHNNPLIEALWKEWASIRRKSKAIWSDTLDDLPKSIRSSELRVRAYGEALDRWDDLPISTTMGRDYDRTLGKFVDVPVRVRSVEYRNADGLRIVETFRERHNLDYSLSSETTTLRHLESLQKTIDKGGEFYPTDYAKTNLREDFAESSMLFLLDPARLKRSSPLRHAFMERLFKEEFIGEPKTAAEAAALREFMAGRGFTI